jgi:hypothetical protein
MGDRQGDAARVIRSSVLLRSTLALLAVALAGTGSICAMALATQSKGEVGGPPSIRLGPPDEGTQTSPALVIGQGAVIDGPVELVAYGWESEADSPPADFCVWVEHPPREIQFGTCGTALSRSGRNPIAIDLDAQVVAPKIARATEVGGRISLRVSAVRLYFRRPGSKKPHRVNAVVAQVDGDLQQRLGQPVPFGFFYAKVHGVVGFGEFHAQALDAEGKIVGTAGH